MPIKMDKNRIIRLSLITFFIFSCFTLLKAQAIHTLRVPVDSIPDFVKQKVSPELYEILETMSHVYIMDYGFLMDGNFSKEKEKEITEGLQLGVYKLIKEGKITKQNPPEVFAVATATRVDAILDWKLDFLYQIDKDIQFCKKSAVAYTGEQSPKAQLQAEIWYVYDKNKKQVLPLKVHVSPVNGGTFSKTPSFIFNDKICETGEYIDVKGSDLLIVDFSGLFQHEDLPEGKPESMRKKFIIQLE